MNKVLLFLLLLTSSCLGNSETESRGVDKVLSFYGGSAVYSRGIVSSTDADELQGKYYEIKISGVEEKMNKYFTSFKLPASNCAYLFYHALTPDEKKEYSFVRIISDNKSSSSKYEYSTKTLDDFESAAILVENSVNYMVDNNYKQFLFNGNALASSKQEWEKF